MKVIGIGIDVADLNRIALAVRRSQHRFLNRVFNAREEQELAQFTGNQLIHQVALRFTLKESVIKAAGGINTGMSWHDICTACTDGRFHVSLEGGFLRWAQQHGPNVEVQVTAMLHRNMALGSAIISVFPHYHNVNI